MDDSAAELIDGPNLSRNAGHAWDSLGSDYSSILYL